MELRSINSGDLEQLRQWKNENRDAFFHKEEITKEQQRSWYEAYKDRINDYMFILSEDGRDIGCIGIRLLLDKWDIYNVIIEENFSNNGRMTQALKTMLHIASCRKDAPIVAKVLKGNHALGWYMKNGFVKSVEHEDHYVMEYVGNPRLYE